jgi:hypothetical protein
MPDSIHTIGRKRMFPSPCAFVLVFECISQLDWKSGSLSRVGMPGSPNA